VNAQERTSPLWSGKISRDISNMIPAAYSRCSNPIATSRAAQRPNSDIECCRKPDASMKPCSAIGILCVSNAVAIRCDQIQAPRSVSNNETARQASWRLMERWCDAGPGDMSRWNLERGYEDCDRMSSSRVPVVASPGRRESRSSRVPVVASPGRHESRSSRVSGVATLVVTSLGSRESWRRVSASQVLASQVSAGDGLASRQPPSARIGPAACCLCWHRGDGST
jgi:hypothetical protein